MKKQEFIQAGFTVIGTENNENKLLRFLQENYPSVIKDNEINLQELKAIAGLPVDEKVNGYGLNFIGRNFARAKYVQKTEKELRLNNTLSKNIDTTENLVLKGDNLDSLKILKNHYSGQIKCIYIDPPYNTTNDDFVYPDKFDKEETEVLGLANLNESDFARMDFSFKTKKSHNGWLAFMYPRLLLARDLLSNDGVIFISIDDNEQANLKLLCDDVFGEENFVANMIRQEKAGSGHDSKGLAIEYDYIICYAKNALTTELNKEIVDVENDEKYKLEDEFVKERGKFYLRDLDFKGSYSQSLDYSITLPNGKEIWAGGKQGQPNTWRWSKKKFEWGIENKFIVFKDEKVYIKQYQFVDNEGNKRERFLPFRALTKFLNSEGTQDLTALELNSVFSFPKSVNMIKYLLKISTSENDIILDFFAGSGTTGHAVMQLNAEDGGKRKFILCQIDEPIKEDKPAYKFCIDNNLPPVISSITIERLKRAGERLNLDFNKKQQDLFNQANPDNLENPDKIKVQTLDIGFKVFDGVEAPKLKVDNKGQISITENETDALSRIYNMIFTVGLDEPTQVPEEVIKDCIYKIGNHYYITNSEKITSDDYANAIKNGKVFIDGWTASLNGTLQNYKEDVKIVF
jgi:adenine-specific DNA-methyltransferase